MPPHWASPMTMHPDPDAVTAVIPAYNAEATLDETLRSVRAQTHRALEIIVVDDGSRDGTAEIARAHAREDPRLRVVQQPNAGVAAARNLGIALARAALVAPVDADDLWAPTKIARQVAVLRAAGPQTGLVYTWSALVDEAGRVVGHADQPTDEGDVLPRLCRGNLVGNGSAALMRRAAVLDAGGYDATLRDRGAQGCEDLLLYCAIAARHRVALVPEILTGYRQRPDSMSRDLAQMMRSWRLVAAELRRRHPERGHDIDAGEAFAAGWLFRRALRAGRLRDAVGIARGGGLAPGVGMRETASLAGYALRRCAARAIVRDRAPAPVAAAPHFHAGGGGVTA